MDLSNRRPGRSRPFSCPAPRRGGVRPALAFGFAVAIGLALSAGAAVPTPPDRVPRDRPWQELIQRSISEREYQVTRSRTGLQAPNRAHDLRTYFEAWGIRVHSRRAGGQELLRLSLAAVGRASGLRPVGPGAVEARGARVEIRRPGLIEWYENSARGLEQGFTLAQPPPGQGPLALELSLEGARASGGGAGAVLQSRSGRRLDYGSLAAFDASGRRLVARLEVPGEARLRLLVEDAGALYPVVVDPLLVAHPAAKVQSNQTGAQLGFAVAGAGDVNADGYDDVIVGAHQYDSGEADEGAAFVFLGGASGLQGGSPGTAATRLESNQPGSEFGISVARAGDVDGDGIDDVIIGARSYDAGQENEGAAFIFLGSVSGIPDGNPATAATRLEANQASAFFGASVAGAGDVNADGISDVIVGAYQYDAGQTDEGAAFVFLGSGSGIPHGDPTSAYAQIESDQAFALLGISVAGAGDVNGDTLADVIVGAPLYDDGEEDEGLGLVFLGNTSGIAGCAGSSPPRCGPADAAARLESNQAGANLGISVAGAGDVDADGFADVIIGADDFGAGEAGEGSAFVFRGSAGGVVGTDPASAATRLEANQAGARLGIGVAGAGDVDGDGYSDVLVGARLYDGDTVVDEGAAFLFLGSASGVASGGPDDAALRLMEGQAGADFGRSVAGVGDLDGDGFDDVCVGAPAHADPLANEGAAFVYWGGLFGARVPALSRVGLALLAGLLGGASLWGLYGRCRTPEVSSP